MLDRGDVIADKGHERFGERLRSYGLLARVLLFKSYRGKIFVAAFAGIQVPLVALLTYSVLGFPGAAGNSRTVTLLVVTLVATMAATAATIYALNVLLTPVALVSQTLREYAEEGRVPDLPTGGVGRQEQLVSDLGYAMEQVKRLDRKVSMLQELSTHDYLTGVYNRRGCEDRLEEDLARVRRGGGALTLAVLDIDYFKSINDEHGHQAGDVCLRHVATTIQDNIRRGDWLARWGGDEFVLVLWDAEPTAETVFDHITGALHENPARLPGARDIGLTVSGGVCRCTGEQDGYECFADADEFLRRAKREGSGRIIFES